MSTTHPGYAAVTQLVTERIGLSLRANRAEGIERGIQRAMQRAGIASLAEYPRRLASDAASLDDLVSELTVGETYFFREPGQFEFLRSQVLPQLQSERGPEHCFRVWSAGCASGEEAYSLAILFDEAGVADRLHLLATDVSRVALARAQRAVYSKWSLRGDGAARALPYLRPHSAEFMLDERIRRRVTLGYLNLALDVYPSLATDTWGMDLILCRNVLIYLVPDMVTRVVWRLFEALAPGGWLVTASSDPPLQELAPFAPVVTEAGVFYRRGERSGRVDELKVEEAEKAAEVDEEVRATRERETINQEDAVQQVRALANRDAAEAERVCAAARARDPLAIELHYMHAILLLDLGRDEEAAAALRRVLYLDRSAAVAHFTLGALLARQGRLVEARRAYRNARDLCAARPAEEPVPLAEGEGAGRLAEAAAFQLTLLETGVNA